MTHAFQRATTAFRRRQVLLAAWRRLSSTERTEFLLFAALIPCIAISLRVAGFRRVRGWLARVRTPRAGDLPHADRVAARAVMRARRFAPYRGNCLSQSLALWWRVRKLGYDARFCLGVRLNGRDFAAHAWVERGGHPLADPPSIRQQFAPLESASVPRH